MRSKGELILEKLETTYTNIYNLLEGFQKASSGNVDVLVPLIQANGTTKEVKINSFQQILNELERLNSNFDNLTAEYTYNITKDGNVSTYRRVSSLKAQRISAEEIIKTGTIDNNREFIENLMFPIVKIPVLLDKGLALYEQVLCDQFVVSFGFDQVKDDISRVEFDHLINSGSVVAQKITRHLNVESKRVDFFGEFTIEDVRQTNDGFYAIKLNTLQYQSRESLGPNKTLVVGDILHQASSNTDFEITQITADNWVTVQSNNTHAVLKPGINVLQFAQKTFDQQSNVIYLPVKPNQKMVCFFYTTNTTYVSFPSNGLKIDTTDITVNNGTETYTLDEYFTRYVTDFSEYLNGLIRETSIPYSLGIRPNRPVLNANNFKVVQINKHLVDTKTKQEIEQLNKQKQSIQNDIDYKNDLIKKTQDEIDTLKFNSLEEKTYRQNRITSLTNEVNILKTNLLSVVRDIDTKATRDGLKNITPKYRILGYWEVQQAIYSPQTKPQHIITYDVQYRYLTKGVDTSDVTTYKMVDKGQEISVAFSNWNQYASTTLNKVETIDGQVKWEDNNLSSVDEININQCSISINESEAVEIRIRAVSEAGYPLSPMKSEWSEIIRIDFPDYLKDSNIRHTVEKNVTDLNIAEFNNVLATSGLLRHIAGQIYEGDKLFLHNAKDISSGQYTQEQKNIPLDVMIQTLINEINILKGNKNTDNIQITFVDTNNERYNITQNSTLEVFAGNYSDEVGGVLEADKFGEIITKRYYISIKNNNSVPIEMRSLVPNESFLTTSTFNQYKNVPVIIDGEYKQKHGQIMYFRNVGLFDVNGSDVLVEDVAVANKTIPAHYKNNSASSDAKNIFVYKETEPIAIAKNMLEQDFDFIAFTNELKQQVPTIEFDKEIERIAKFGNVLSKQTKQKKIVDGDSIGFSKIIDKYSIGKNTCGAWLYPRLDKIEKFVTNGNSAISSLIIEPDNEVLIPIEFEYRMSDRLGRVYTQSDNDPLGLNLEYSKKLGVSLNINSTEFKFDIKVSAKYKSKVALLDNRNISKLSGIYNRETKKTLI